MEESTLKRARRIAEGDEARYAGPKGAEGRVEGSRKD